MTPEASHCIIPVFIPMQGCPNACYYCNQSVVTGMSGPPSREELNQIVRQHLSTINTNARVELAFYGGSFTGLPIEKQREYLEWANGFKNSGSIHTLRLSTRPDYITAEILRLLKSFGVESIELGAQSMHDDVLLESGRGHSTADTLRASEMILRAGFRLGLQMMTGLPQDTPKKSIQTAERIVAAGAHETRIYPSVVFSGTRLEELLHEGKYSPQTTEDAVETLACLIPVFEQGNVQILRIGLNPLSPESSGRVVAGPVQQGLREKALTLLWWQLLEPVCKNSGKHLKVFVHPSQLNYASGFQKANRKKLQKHFGVVSFVPNPDLHGREYFIDIS